MLCETERLILRRFEQQDMEGLFDYLSDSVTLEFEPYSPMNRQETRQELERRILDPEMIAVERKQDGALLGNLYLGRREFNSFELGYVFNRKFWGHGYAKESADALIRHTFSQGAHRIYAMCDPLNPNSWHLLESLHFRREAHYLQDVYFWSDENGNPLWKDTFVYGLLRGERME